jgi:hypothetical protein
MFPLAPRGLGTWGLLSGEEVMQQQWDADPKGFNQDHRDPYNDAARK